MSPHGRRGARPLDHTGASDSSVRFRPCTGVRSYDVLTATAPLGRLRGQVASGLSMLHQPAATTDLEISVPPCPDIVVLANLRPCALEAGLGRPPVRHQVHTGDSTIIPAGMGSAWRLPAGSGDVVHMHLSPDLLAALLEEDLSGRPLDIVPTLTASDEVIAAISRSCYAELGQPGPASSILAQSHALALAVRLLRAHSTLGHAPPMRALAMAPYRLMRARDFIEAHLGEPIGLTEIAAAAGLSPHHFARAFKAATGRSPYRMVIERRIERAKALMREGRLGLAEVALACGFSSQQQFTTTFHRIAGAPPGQWRRAQTQ